MKPKNQRLIILNLSLLMIAGAVWLALDSFQDHLVFFYTPTQMSVKKVRAQQHISIGGLVEKGSLHKAGLTCVFDVTDLNQSIKATYTGILPDLFREGQGVVLEGQLDDKGVFQAKTVLAKHDENYRPPALDRAIKRHQK
jgi:cytochrome c-type biogenesis protein CcmE